MLNKSLDRISARTPVALGALVLVFVVTRFLGGAGAINFGAVSDVETAYRRWAVRVVEMDRAPYVDVDIEYPPGSLPFVLVPQLAEPDERGYRVNFVALMLLADLACLMALLSLSKRWGSMVGPWLWVVGIPLLGSLVYLRLDLIPAAATLWAIQRASKQDWFGSGAFLGFGIVAKLYPLLLMPLALLTSPRRSVPKLLLGSGAIVVLALLPFATVLGNVFREVVEYHTSRGIQVESLWGSVLFIARSGTRFKNIVHDFGAHHFESGLVPQIKIVASIATAAAAGAGIWLVRKGTRSATELAGISFVTLMLSISVSGVLSPQFFIWVLAAGAAAICAPDSRLKGQIVMLLPILLMTRVIYPTLHPALVTAEVAAIVVLWARNLLLLMTSIWALSRQSEPGEQTTTPTEAEPAAA